MRPPMGMNVGQSLWIQSVPEFARYIGTGEDTNHARNCLGCSGVNGQDVGASVLGQRERAVGEPLQAPCRR